MVACLFVIPPGGGGGGQAAGFVLARRDSANVGFPKARDETGSTNTSLKGLTAFLLPTRAFNVIGPLGCALLRFAEPPRLVVAGYCGLRLLHYG